MVNTRSQAMQEDLVSNVFASLDIRSSGLQVQTSQEEASLVSEISAGKAGRRERLVRGLFAPSQPSWEVGAPTHVDTLSMQTARKWLPSTNTILRLSAKK